MSLEKAHKSFSGRAVILALKYAIVNLSKPFATAVQLFYLSVLCLFLPQKPEKCPVLSEFS